MSHLVLPYSLVHKLKMATWLSSYSYFAISCHKTVKVGRRLWPIFLGYASYKPRVLLGSRYASETLTWLSLVKVLLDSRTCFKTLFYFSTATSISTSLMLDPVFCTTYQTAWTKMTPALARSSIRSLDRHAQLTCAVVMRLVIFLLP